MRANTGKAVAAISEHSESGSMPDSMENMGRENVNPWLYIAYSCC